MQHLLYFHKIDFKNADKSFLKFRNYFDSKSSIVIENIKINFLGLDEPNYGRLILKVQILEDNIDITSKICKDGFCSPIEIEFIDYENHTIYFPFDHQMVFYKIKSKEVKKIIFPNKLKGFKYIYKVNKSIIILFNNGYLNINLQTLEMFFSVIENIDFITYIQGKELVFKNNFTEILYDFQHKSSQIDISKIYDTSFNKYLSKSYVDSQKGYLWNNGFTNIENEKILRENNWDIIGYSDTTKTLTIGTLIILDKGSFNESQRTMWFKTKNEYLKLELEKTLLLT